MEKVWNAVQSVARAAVWGAGVMLLAAAVIVTAEVLSRKGLGIAFSGSDEIASYLFAVGTSWSLAFVLTTRGNVRIDALYTYLPRAVRAVLDVVSLLVLGLFMLAVTERAWALAADSIASDTHSNTPLQVPLAIPQTLWLAGILLFMVTWLVLLARMIAALARGDRASFDRMAAIASQDEEVASEIEGLELGAPPAGERGR